MYHLECSGKGCPEDGYTGFEENTPRGRARTAQEEAKAKREAAEERAAAGKASLKTLAKKEEKDPPISSSSRTGQAVAVILGLLVVIGMWPSPKDGSQKKKSEPTTSSPTRTYEPSTINSAPAHSEPTSPRSEAPRQSIEPATRPQEKESAFIFAKPDKIERWGSDTVGTNPEVKGKTLFHPSEVDYYIHPQGTVFYVFHGKEIPFLPISHVEYNKDTGELIAVTPSNVRHYVGPLVTAPAMKKVMGDKNEVHIIQTDDDGYIVSGVALPLYFFKTQANEENHIVKRPEDGAEFFVPYLAVYDLNTQTIQNISSFEDVIKTKSNAFPWHRRIHPAPVASIPDLFQDVRLDFTQPLYTKIKSIDVPGTEKGNLIVHIDSEFQELMKKGYFIDHIEYDAKNKVFYAVNTLNQRQPLMPPVEWSSLDVENRARQERDIVLKYNKEGSSTIPLYFKPRSDYLEIKRPADGAILLVPAPVHFDLKAPRDKDIHDYQSLVASGKLQVVQLCKPPLPTGARQNMDVFTKTTSIAGRTMVEFNYRRQLEFPVSHIEILDGMFPVFVGTDGRRVISCQQISREVKNFIDFAKASDLFNSGAILTRMQPDPEHDPKLSHLVPLFKETTPVPPEDADRSKPYFVISNEKIVDCRQNEIQPCWFSP